ncbi:MAG: glycerol kinase GlpK [Fimbriimonadaceae bacterium]|nr:glycerol kinase GlpK [Fimbriimonadaceae bacterium]
MHHPAAVLALDAGTSSVRALLFGAGGELLGLAQRELTQYYPQPGWVEHDPAEIWAAQQVVAVEAVARAGLTAADVAAVGVANQRETVVLWDRATGQPLHRAIVWQDRRTAGHCDRLRPQWEVILQQRTGLLLDAYFTATKLSWLLEQVPGAKQRAAAGELAAGTIDSWLAWCLTGGRVHATDASNASRTMLYNLATGDWDGELLELFGVPSAVLPAIRGSAEVWGEVSALAALAGVPLAGVAGDQQAALFGQLAVQPGMVKCTYGTGCFMLQHTGVQPLASQQRLISTVAWQRGGRREFALEGSVFVGGAVVQWLRDGLGLVESAAELDALAASVPDSGAVVLVPAFAGLGAPHWDAYARGTILGLTRDTSRAQLARAALDGIAFQVADLLDAMAADTGKRPTELRVDGGATRSEPLLQAQADLLQLPVVRPAVTETTALGAAYLAGLAVGVWAGTAELGQQWRVDRMFEPRLPADQAAQRRRRWQVAVARAREWETPPA